MQTLDVKTSLTTRTSGTIILTDIFNGSKKISEIIEMIVGRSYNDVREIEIKRRDYAV